MKTQYQAFKKAYFSRELDFRARLFNVLALSGAFISLLTCIESLCTAMWYTAAVSAVMIVVSLFIMVYARKSGNYRRFYYITILVIFLIFFPILFFTSGGYRSGMPAVFIFAVLFTMLMLDGGMAFLMMTAELIVYNFVCWICYRYPQLVTQYTTEKASMEDILFAFSAVSMVCGIVIFLHLKEYNRQRESLRQKNTILREMDDAKSTFLTTVAHEVKNPLNIISLHAQDTSELLEEEPLDLAQIKENQKIIQDTVMRIDQVLTDLMDTVSIEQGRLKLSLMPMMLLEVVRAAAQPWEKQYRLGHIKTNLVVDMEGTLPPICADYARLQQVMANLLSNAFRHTKEGTVTIHLKNVPEGQLVCVEDNGEGMDEAIRKKALEGYVSANKDYWRHGIGLYVCHRVVQAHGGRIWIESEAGKGTKVFFTLPQKEDVE